MTPLTDIKGFTSRTALDMCQRGITAIMTDPTIKTGRYNKIRALVYQVTGLTPCYGMIHLWLTQNGFWTKQNKKGTIK